MGFNPCNFVGPIKHHSILVIQSFCPLCLTPCSIVSSGFQAPFDLFCCRGWLLAERSMAFSGRLVSRRLASSVLEATAMHYNCLFAHFWNTFDFTDLSVNRFHWLSGARDSQYIAVEWNRYWTQFDRENAITLFKQWIKNATRYLYITGQVGGILCRILEKIYRDISGVYCIHRMVFYCLWVLSVILLYCESIKDI